VNGSHFPVNKKYYGSATKYKWPTVVELWKEIDKAQRIAARIVLLKVA
jgi:hypothetical protein